MTQADGQKPSGRRKRRPPYRPVRAFLSLGISAGALAAALVRAFPETASQAGRAIQLLDGATADGEPGFFGRIPANSYIEMMVSLLALVLLYSLVQLYGVNRDFRWFAARTESLGGGRTLSIFDAFFCVLSGRPKGFYATGKEDTPKTDRERLAIHLKFGMPALAVPTRFFLWSFPMLGFLGTAIGLSNAIRLLPGAMGKGGGNALEPVLRQLAFKFDTTILGIVSALIVMALIQLYERAWQNLEILANGPSDAFSVEPAGKAVETTKADKKSRTPAEMGSGFGAKQ